MISQPSKLLLGLIGAGIQESRSPAMHEHEAAQHGIGCLYQLIDLERLSAGAEALPELLLAAERMGFAGLNITHPCKQAVVELLDELSPEARALGAVNTVVLRDGKRVGHNTDWWAFAESFRRGLPGAPIERVVQVGAGGAGSATAFAALKLGAGQVSIFDVARERAETLLEKLNRQFPDNRARTRPDLEEALREADGVIHATPTGMASHPGVPFPIEWVRPEMWLAEVVYFPLETELLRAAKGLGCRTMDGGGMAVFQAVEAFRLFTGLQADAERMQRCFAAMGSTT